MAISWSCVARDGVILAEAGQDDGSGSIIKTAKKLTQMRPTPGWEKTRCGSFRGIKLHIHEPISDYVNGTESTRMLVWCFCCVYRSDALSEQYAKSFLTKISFVTEPLREAPWWIDGDVLAAQESFAPTLQQQMDNVGQLGRIALLNQHVDETKEIMAENIERILERGEKLDDLHHESSKLNAMSAVFKKRAKKLRRIKMWQNAKHGVMVGTAITGAVGIVVIPPLIALL